LARSDRIAQALRGFGPPGTVAIFVIVAGSLLATSLGAILVLVWTLWSRTRWSDLGFSRPPSWVRTVAIGVFSGAAFKLLMKSIVMPLLGGPAINPTYHWLAGNTAALPGILFVVIVAAGFAEEVVFRGYFFERLGRLLGGGMAAKTTIVLVTSAWFAAGHYADQRLAGVEQAAITGLVFGTLFALTGRIWMPMIVHAAFDVAAIAIIYWNVESNVAHLFFR
jgi:membrane protease YdiL (CAAX protease family)